MSSSTLDNDTVASSIRPANTFLSIAENLALPIGKEGQREDVVCFYLVLLLL